MYTVGSAFYALRNALLALYNEREGSAVAHGAMEHITGLSKVDRLIAKETHLSPEENQRFEEALAMLPAGVPLQYFTEEAWFLGDKYLVNENVLIPRPETEELVQWVISDNENSVGVRILDVGTGSGCIPVSLARHLPSAVVDACDVSEGALRVARRNASAYGLDINFFQLDFLDIHQWETLGSYDVVVSNPPYIPLAEKERLHTNVRDHEPSLALFVPDSDPLVFYAALARLGKTHLVAGGAIYCELDAAHALATAEMFREEGYSQTDVRKDMHDNLRLLRARF